MSHAIVVDASVARSAGVGRPNARPPAPQSVACLEAIRKSGLKVAMNTELKQEWRMHARPYASKWLMHRIATRRYVRGHETWEDEVALLDAAADLPGNQPKEVAKDVHLVGLAMTTDRRVLSGDERQKRLLTPSSPLSPSCTTCTGCPP